MKQASKKLSSIKMLCFYIIISLRTSVGMLIDYNLLDIDVISCLRQFFVISRKTKVKGIALSTWKVGWWGIISDTAHRSYMYQRFLGRVKVQRLYSPNGFTIFILQCIYVKLSFEPHEIQIHFSKRKSSAISTV